MPRHQLTPEERARGHKLTHADRVKGGANTSREAVAARLAARYAARARRASPQFIASGKPHRFTKENARAMALKGAAKRRGERLAKMLTRAKQDFPPMTPERFYEQMREKPKAPGPYPLGVAYCGPAKRGTDSPSAGLAITVSNNHDETVMNAMAEKLGTPEATAGGEPEVRGYLLPSGPASQAEYLDYCAAIGERRLASEPPLHHGPEVPKPDSIDPFTLSALKRFRLGPVSPLALTRSQRTHVTVMRNAGYLEADGVSMLRLTDKGWDAIKAGDLETVKMMGE